jgi:hypothetical protein
MADLSIKTTVTNTGDYRWLLSPNGPDGCISVTLVRSLLQPGTHYDANGIVPSGLPLGKVSGSATYGPYDPAAADGRQYLAGFLLHPEQLKANFGGVTTEASQVSMLVQGIIAPEHVPTQPTLDTQTPTTGQFVFAHVEYVAPPTPPSA